MLLPLSVKLGKLRKFGQYSKYLFQNLTGENKGDMLSEYREFDS